MPLLLFRMHGWEAFRARALEIVWTGLDWTGVIPFVLQRKSFRAGKATTEKHIPERVVSCALYLCVLSSPLQATGHLLGYLDVVAKPRTPAELEKQSRSSIMCPVRAKSWWSPLFLH